MDGGEAKSKGFDGWVERKSEGFDRWVDGLRGGEV